MLTVAELKTQLEDLPDDAVVVISAARDADGSAGLASPARYAVTARSEAMPGHRMRRWVRALPRQIELAADPQPLVLVLG